jgi:hypothetical protein
VAELVEEGLDVVVLQQPRLAWRGPREIAHQSSFRELSPTHAVQDGEFGRVLVLVGARVHVEVDSAQPLATLVHVVALDVGRPPTRRLHPAVLDAEELRRHLEQPLLHPFVGVVGPHRLRVESELLRLDALLVVVLLPVMHGDGVRQVAPLAFQKLGVVLLRTGGRDGRDPSDEFRSRDLVADHLVLSDVGGPILVPEPPGQLVAARQEPIEAGHVRGITPIAKLPVEPLARPSARGVRHERRVVGVVGGDLDHAVRPRGMRPHVIVGQPLEVPWLDGDGPAVGLHVAGELLSDERQLVVELADALPRGLVSVHAGAPEIPQGALDVVARARILARDVEPAQRLVHASVQRQLGHELHGFLSALLGSSAHLGVGVDALEEMGLVARRIELDLNLVVGDQGVIDGAGRPHVEQLLERAPRRLEALAHLGHDRLGGRRARLVFGGRLHSLCLLSRRGPSSCGPARHVIRPP